MRSDDMAQFGQLCAEARAILAKIRTSRRSIGDLIESSQEALAKSRLTLLEADETLTRLHSPNGRLAAGAVGRAESEFAAIQAVEEHPSVALENS